jgi:hypothetical protein
MLLKVFFIGCTAFSIGNKFVVLDTKKQNPQGSPRGFLTNHNLKHSYEFHKVIFLMTLNFSSLGGDFKNIAMPFNYNVWGLLK